MPGRRVDPASKARPPRRLARSAGLVILPAMDFPEHDPDPSRPITVSDLNRRVRTLLERGVGRLWVQGEVSNLARPASGHLYFSLKDESAQIRCAWFRQRQRGQSRDVANGDQMLAFGRISLYEPRGDYQLIVEQLEPAGEGELRRRFERLKRKLDAEGLFDEAWKRPLPTLPRRIGVVTSPSGAAIRDILTVLGRRFPTVPVVVYPAAVQGAAAVPELTAALDTAAERAECDVLIVGRGGGSLEDLWAFNEEAVARAIRQSPIPVISAVGHEVDVTIADLVADRRAPTPSGAAEIAVPEQQEWRRHVDRAASRLASLVRRELDDRYQALDWLGRRLTVASPARRLEQQRERLVTLTRSLTTALRHDLVVRGRRIDAAHASLLRHSPAARVERLTATVDGLGRRLGVAGRNAVERLRARLNLAGRALDAVSPLATLERGYAIVTDARTGRLLTDAASTSPGAEIRARLARGSVIATVKGSDE